MFFIDVQGTLIDDNKQPINGAINFIDELNIENIPYIVVTNNTKQESENFLKYLNSIGLSIPRKKYLDPLMVLEKHLTSKNLLVFGTDNFLSVLTDRGYIIDSQNPDVLLLGVKNNYTFEEFSIILETILNNKDIQLIGMHGTSIYLKNGKRYPGVGAILEMIKYATGQSYQIIGKPSNIFYYEALNKMGESSFKKITMISDDLKGDLVGAKNLGMKTVLVLSGKIKTVDEIGNNIDEQPDYIFNSVLDFFN